MPLGWGFYVEPVFFNIFSCELYFDGCIDSRALLDFSIYGSGSWRGCTLKIVSWSVEGKVRFTSPCGVNSLEKRLAWGNWEQEEALHGALSQLSSESWRSIQVGGDFNVIKWGQTKKGRDHFLLGELTSRDTMLIF